MATVTLNGVVLAPTTVETNTRKVGELKEMANGTKRFFHRAIKRTWTLSWQNAPAALVSTAYGAFAVTTPVTFIDQDGASFTVISAGEMVKTLDASLTSISNALYYSFSFSIDEV